MVQDSFCISILKETGNNINSLTYKTAGKWDKVWEGTWVLEKAISKKISKFIGCIIYMKSIGNIGTCKKQFIKDINFFRS